MNTSFLSYPFMMSGSGCTGCKAAGVISLVVYAVVALFMLYASYDFVQSPTTSVIGSPALSLSMLTFLVAYTLFMKKMKKMCPCGCMKGCNGGDCKDGCCK